MKPIPSHPLAAGLKLALLFNGGAGAILYDASGNTNHGVGANHAFVAEGIELAGDNEHITIPNFIGQDDDWTIFVSFNQSVRNPNTQVGHSHFVSMDNGSGTTGRSILYIGDGNTPTYVLKSFIDGTGFNANTVIDINKDYTGGLVQEGTSFKFYLNGVVDGSLTKTADPSDGNIILFDAKNATGDGCFAGTSKVLYWYDRPLSANEMRWLDRDPTGMFMSDFTPALITVAGEAGVANAGALMMAMMI